MVGFPVIESAVDESISTKYTCLQIFSGGPLLSDASIQFYTLDGSAKGRGYVGIHCKEMPASPHNYCIAYHVPELPLTNILLMLIILCYLHMSQNIMVD